MTPVRQAGRSGRYGDLHGDVIVELKVLLQVVQLHIEAMETDCSLHHQRGKQYARSDQARRMEALGYRLVNLAEVALEGPDAHKGR